LSDKSQGGAVPVEPNGSPEPEATMAAGLLQKPIVFVLISIAIGVLVGALILVVAGYNPLRAYGEILAGVFSGPRNIATAIVRSTPIILTGLSVSFAFRTGLFNIGAEGQFLVGSLAAALVGFSVSLPPYLHIPLVFLAAMAAGALWGGLSGFLKARFGVHEVISTIMLNWLAFYLNNYIVSLPGVKRPESEASLKIAASARIDVLGTWKMTPEGLGWRREHAGSLYAELLRAEVNWGIVVALIVVTIVWFILKKTTLGYELRAVGHNQDAAEYGGVNVNRSIVISMAIAGAIAALSGALQVMGRTQEITKLAVMEGNGFDGIAVSLIGNNTAFGNVFAGLLFGGLVHGGGRLQARMGAPSEIIDIVIGTIIFFIAIPNLIRVLARARRRAKAKKEVRRAP
jgi:general nucleoside transport system permease protein